VEKRAELEEWICKLQCFKGEPDWWEVFAECSVWKERQAGGWLKRLQKLGWCFLGVQPRGRDFTKPTFTE
jgi:hypothetical protein